MSDFIITLVNKIFPLGVLYYLFIRLYPYVEEKLPLTHQCLSFFITIFLDIFNPVITELDLVLSWFIYFCMDIINDSIGNCCRDGVMIVGLFLYYLYSFLLTVSSSPSYIMNYFRRVNRIYSGLGEEDTPDLLTAGITEVANIAEDNAAPLDPEEPHQQEAQIIRLLQDVKVLLEKQQQQQDLVLLLLQMLQQQQQLQSVFPTDPRHHPHLPPQPQPHLGPHHHQIAGGSSSPPPVDVAVPSSLEVVVSEPAPTSPLVHQGALVNFEEVQVPSRVAALLLPK
jgi:hypothetical protein